MVAALAAVTPESAAKWIGIVAAAITVASPVVLFFSYRADYVRAGVAEPTLLAFQLTLSSLRKLKRFKAGDAEHPHRRAGDDRPHSHVRAEDMGTVSRPASDFTPPRRTPDHGQRHHDGHHHDHAKRRGTDARDD